MPESSRAGWWETGWFSMRPTAPSNSSTILFTRFVNREGGPYRQFLDWHECAGEPDTLLAPELERFAAPDRVFAKPGYAGISDELATYLQERDYEQIALAGIDTVLGCGRSA